MTTGRPVRFGSFQLDLRDEQLWRGGEPVALRPKTFAVLRYLVEHKGSLVTRDELVRAVWPNTHGAEKGPKRCILELRTALGDDVGAPQVIETVGRRGYRLIAQLTALTPSTSRVLEREEAVQTPGVDIEPAAAAVVGRDPELTLLHHCLDVSLRGERAVVFVSGEAGIGKTSLVETFLEQVNDPLCSGGASIGRGQCIEHHGEGEAYLPVLEALGSLGRKAGSPLPELLRRHAPSWLAQLPALLGAAEDSVPERVRGATRPRMLREIGDLIDAMTMHVPLVLVLEDLHWSDYSTLDFLSAVAQRREPARLLVVGTYRSAATASDDPLLPVVQELVSHGRARELPLAGIAESAVQTYLDNRFPGHAFSPALAQHLHLRTEGHPLFLVNLVDDLVAQEVVFQDSEAWTSRVPPEAGVALVPENSRRLIEKHMARLDAESQAILEAASVAGVEFAADAVASALGVNPEHVEERCEELARQNVFLRRAGLHGWPDGTVITRYAFRHALYQQLWYERLPARRRQRFHLRIGERLEESFGAHAGEIAAELALHFDEGRDRRRGARYREHAARNALQRSAHREAVDHLTKAIALVTQLPEAPERAQQELALQIVLGVPLTATVGYASPEVERVYHRALELSEQVADASQIVQALLGLWVFHFLRADLHTARRLGERCLQQTDNAQATDLLVDAHNAMGGTLLWLGEPASAREHLERGLSHHADHQHSSYVLHDTTDPEVACLANLAWSFWFLGYPDRALRRSEEALALAQRLAHPYSLGYALTFAAVLHCFARDFRQACERADAAIAIAADHGFPLWSAMGTILRSWALVQEGQLTEGPRITEGLAALQAIGAELGRTAFLALLAESLAMRGKAREGLVVLSEALSIAERKGERLYAAEIHRLKGELILRRSAEGAEQGVRASAPLESRVSRAAAQAAEGHYLEAIGVAKQQRALSLELRAALGLSRLWHAQNKSEAAQALLSEIHGRFTEGFGSADLRAAEGLLRDLKKKRPGTSRSLATAD